MDRFIGKLSKRTLYCTIYLKSNMDRFIVFDMFNSNLKIPKFKIQYG